MKEKKIASQIKRHPGKKRSRKRVPEHMKHMKDQLPGWGQGLKEWCDVVKPTGGIFQEDDHRADVSLSSPDVGPTSLTLCFHSPNTISGSSSPQSAAYFPDSDFFVPPPDPPVHLGVHDWQMPHVTPNTSRPDRGGISSPTGSSLNSGQSDRINSSDPFFELLHATSIDHVRLPHEMPHPNYHNDLPDAGTESNSPLSFVSSPAWSSSNSLNSRGESYHSNYDIPSPYGNFPADSQFLNNSLDTSSSRLGMVGHTQSRVSRREHMHTPNWNPPILDPGSGPPSRGLAQPTGFPGPYSFSLDPCYDRDTYYHPDAQITSGDSSSSNGMCSCSYSRLPHRHHFQPDLRSSPQGMTHPTQSGMAALPGAVLDQHHDTRCLSVPFCTAPLRDTTHGNSVPPQSSAAIPSNHIHQSSHSTSNNLDYTDRFGYPVLRSDWHCNPPDFNPNRPSPY